MLSLVVPSATTAWCPRRKPRRSPTTSGTISWAALPPNGPWGTPCWTT
ncbi:hypothetical protein MUK42_35368 [Musa troglodytarum]|uniref:Uncharacterized protein n=1 Tax=Musa troglodytarum TaxID=320322 RepID=A0A9E7HKW5_9LILI|nr:hypothetical protein MUK42_35368 [Musa troglodytarum]